MFILSIILVFVVALVIIIAYYNIVLALRGQPPFRVATFMPQILFPRGPRGLGRHNVEEEQDSGVNKREDYKKLAEKVYRPLNSSLPSSPTKREYKL